MKWHFTKTATVRPKNCRSVLYHDLFSGWALLVGGRTAPENGFPR